jgi:hypothetical protein
MEIFEIENEMTKSMQQIEFCLFSRPRNEYPNKVNHETKNIINNHPQSFKHLNLKFIDINDNDVIVFPVISVSFVFFPFILHSKIDF